ncbi:MAG: GNAT family N-acetyltransferase, partial [Pseudomonadota bacterium]
AILLELLKSAHKLNLNEVYLHAQTTAVPFYEKQGFKICSEKFMDADIPHKSMKKDLNLITRNN